MSNIWGYQMSDEGLSHGPSFLTLTTFASRRRGMTMDGAVRAGELTRKVTMPAVTSALLPYTIGVVGSASLVAGPTLGVAGRYVVTKGSLLYASGMTMAGTPAGQELLNTSTAILSSFGNPPSQPMSFIEAAAIFYAVYGDWKKPW